MESVFQMLSYVVCKLAEALFSTEVPFADLIGFIVNFMPSFVLLNLLNTLFRAIVAAPVAYLAWRKGYRWWGIFLLSLLVMPAAVAAVLAVLPRIESGCAVWPRSGGEGLSARAQR